MDDLSSAPIGTLAPAIMGGAWRKVQHGWQWNGHHENPRMRGSTFPRPGGDWTGELIYQGEPIQDVAKAPPSKGE